MGNICTTDVQTTTSYLWNWRFIRYIGIKYIQFYAKWWLNSTANIFLLIKKIQLKWIQLKRLSLIYELFEQFADKFDCERTIRYKPAKLFSFKPDVISNKYVKIFFKMHHEKYAVFDLALWTPSQRSRSFH